MKIKKYFPESVWFRLRLLKAAAGQLAFRLLWVFPINNNKVIFSNFNGKGYGDNPKYLAEEFIKRRGMRLYWLTTNPSQYFPKEIIPVKYNSLAALFHLATAKIWIFNNRKDPYFVKRKNQFYLQIWHGSIALKKIERDVKNSLDQFYIINAVQDSKMIDLMVSDSSFSDQLYRRSFWYRGEVKRLGTPRFDPLFDSSNCVDIRSALGIHEDQYVVFYAPTFRNNADASLYDIDLAGVKHAFEKKMGKTVKILVRMHPNIPAGYVKFDSSIADDVTSYPDIYDLLKISDALITDYSGFIFEFSIAEPKPVFAYAKDRDYYDRGFYFDLDKLPYLFARSNQELLEGIASFDADDYERRLGSFYKDIDIVADGKASKRIVDYVLRKTRGGN